MQTWQGTANPFSFPLGTGFGLEECPPLRSISALSCEGLGSHIHSSLRVESRAGIDRPSVDRPGLGRLDIGTPGVDRLGVDGPGIDRPGIDRLEVGRPSVDRLAHHPS